MAQPGAGDVHVNTLLTNLSLGYKNPAYIAEQIFPSLTVNKQSDIIPKYDQSPWFRDEVKELGPTEAAPVSGYTVDTSDTYFCRHNGLGHMIPDDQRDNQDSPFDADRDATEWLLDKMLIRKERAFASAYWATTKWTTDLTGGSSFTKWNSYASSVPIEDIRGAIRTVRRLIGGVNPNYLALGDLTWDRIQDHPDMMDRIKYGASAGSPALVTTNLLAQLLGLTNVLVGYAMYTASPEGTAEGSVTYTSIFDDDALLYYRPATPSLFKPSAGYTFIWKTAMGGARYVRKRREPLGERADLIEVFESFHIKQTAARAGLFFSDAVD